MDRYYLAQAIQEDAVRSGKMAFVSGPRQVGKTTMVKSIIESPLNYFTWDDDDFRKAWVKSPAHAVSGRGKGPVVLDEIHKDRFWKRSVKGLYDTKYIPFIVTGSARLDIYRKGADSLTGRYFPYNLFPFSVAETDAPCAPDQILKHETPRYRWADLLRLGAFPEPLFGGSEAKANRWSRLRMDRLVLEDSRDLMNISDNNRFRIMLDLMSDRVGSLFSYNSLREDVGMAYATIRSWAQTAVSLYYGFLIKPWSKSVKRSLTSEPKFYLFDILRIPAGEQGKRRENLAALHLAKACRYWTDTAQGVFDLFFLRDKEKREVDFLIVRDKKPWMMVEVKSGVKEISPSLSYFHGMLQPQMTFQIVDSPPAYRRFHADSGITVIGAERFFAGLL